MDTILNKAHAPDPDQSPTQPAGMQLLNLVKVFGQTIAAASINLTIPAGSFYGLIGPNGAGKTTTLSMCTGLLIPDSGTALVQGIDIWSQPEHAKKLIGVLPDAMRLFDRLTGPELVTYAGLLRGMSPDTARNRAHDLINALGLSEANKTLVTDYSAGMTKKVSLACAMIHAPAVLVLDEPFESVDPISAKSIQEMLANFCVQGGTVILSSHVMSTVQKLCTHVAVIDHGHVLASGTTQEVAAGVDLDERFAQLVGRPQSSEELTWLRPCAD